MWDEKVAAYFNIFNVCLQELHDTMKESQHSHSGQLSDTCHLVAIVTARPSLLFDSYFILVTIRRSRNSVLLFSTYVYLDRSSLNSNREAQSV